MSSPVTPVVHNRAVFFDRDGTLSEEVGYVNHISRFQLLPTTGRAIRKLNDAGWRAIVVTNQAGVARGYFEESLIGQVHTTLRAELAKDGAFLDAIYYCPHHPSAGEPPYRQNCNCRKPKTGMLEQAVNTFKVDLSRSYVVGDKYSDVELAHRVGAKGILVLTGYGRGEYEYQRQSWPRDPDFIAEHVLEAVEWILATNNVQLGTTTDRRNTPRSPFRGFPHL
ncbi:MAG: HAD family hydrolase [Acidobacteria bacterium]|nr:HAD family hydrolase [Acidobacteriota bacterium]